LGRRRGKMGIFCEIGQRQSGRKATRGWGIVAERKGVVGERRIRLNRSRDFVGEERRPTSPAARGKNKKRDPQKSEEVDGLGFNKPSSRK